MTVRFLGDGTIRQTWGVTLRGCPRREGGMARLRVVSILAALAVALSIPGTALASGSASPAHFCTKAGARFYPRHVDVGTKVGVNFTLDNCGSEKIHIPVTWRIDGPCHPHKSGTAVFVLRRNEGLVAVFGFRPKCVGQYRLTVRAYHKNRLVDVARDYLRSR
jgi:hypothetical protein